MSEQKKLTGLFANLTEEQKAKALSLKDDVNFGPEELLLKNTQK